MKVSARISVLLAALLAAVALPSCRRAAPAAAAASAGEPVAVRTAVVAAETLPAVVPVAGTVRPVERAVVAAKVGGTIAALPLAVGQSVAAGELLVRLAAPEHAARVAQARAQFAQAEREEKRNRDLAAAGADSADAARAAADRLNAARAALDEAEAMLAYLELRAPYAGRVAQKLAYPGDFASPGQPLLVLETSAALQVDVLVPASLAGSLALGQALPVRLDANAAAIRCTIAEIAAAADTVTRTVLVKLAWPATAPALSGTYATVDLAGPPAEALTVPAAAVARLGQMERVFVVTGDRAQLRLVKTGATRGERTEILAGLAAGERVVLAPPLALRDGQPLRPTP